MPGKSLDPSTDAVSTHNLTSLKGHKSLPHNNHVAVGSSHMRPLEQQRTRPRSDQITYTSAERIKSWIPDPSPIRVIPVVGAPLTPPINFRDGFQSWIDDAALRKRDFVKTKVIDNVETTPPIQQSPPTPEFTPPKKIYRAQAVASFSSSRDAIEGRTDSFKTAQENQSSDDESRPLNSSSLQLSRLKWLRAVGLPKDKGVGLGLGLGSEDGEQTPRETSPRLPTESQVFVAFDGVWGESSAVKNNDVVLEDPVKPTSRKASHTRPRLLSEPTMDSPTLGDGLSAVLKKSTSLQRKAEQREQLTPNASTEKYTEQMDWPLKNDMLEVDSETREVVNKRLSQVSSSSTVVEVMVIDSPPRRRQTLRRTSKIQDLTSPVRYSNRDSSTSNDPSLRRRLRRSGSTDQELRKSFVSDTADNLATDSFRTQRDIAPVIPDRRSSLLSSTSGSKHHSGTCSLTSRQQSSRPTTAPEEAVGYFDIPRPRDRRTMSVVIHAATPLKSDDVARGEKPATTSAEPTPPSVPTSSTEEPSKTTSVTSTGLDATNASAAPSTQENDNPHLNNSQGAQDSSPDQPSTGECLAMRPRSTLVTPFSLRSAHSSTPGTLEVNEATAISIYPHTNKSILVIQQLARGNDSSPRERSTIVAGNANIALPGTVVPTVLPSLSPNLSGNRVDSPLQNPRDPPQPPNLKIIPPTPANGAPSPEKQGSPPRTPVRVSRFTAPVSSLKRALSARRPRSETYLAPFTRSFSLRGTAGNPRRRSHADEEPHARLHPFWRPRDLGHESDSDSDSEFGNTGDLPMGRVQKQGSKEQPPGRTMSLTRRLSNSFRPAHHARRPRPSSMGAASDGHYYEFRRRSGSESERSPREHVPGQGYQVQSVGFRGWADRLERRREAREEGKREERRQWLRGKIGAVKPGSVRHNSMSTVG